MSRVRVPSLTPKVRGRFSPLTFFFPGTRDLRISLPRGSHNLWYSVVVSRRGSLIPNMENTNGVGRPPKMVRRLIAQGRLTANLLGPRLIRLDPAEVLQLGRPVGAA